MVPGTTFEREITVTAGATQAIFTAIACLVQPGDEVIVFEPVYDSYEPSIRLNGGTPVYARLSFPDYRPDWNAVRELVSQRTRMVIVNTPHNPSGAMLSRHDFVELEAIVRGTDIVIVSDEVYEHIVFDGRKHQSVAGFPALAERSFVVSSFGLSRHRLENRVLPRATRADGRVPEGTPVRGVLRARPVAACPCRLHAEAGLVR